MTKSIGQEITLQNAQPGEFKADPKMLKVVGVNKDVIEAIADDMGNVLTRFSLACASGKGLVPATDQQQFQALQKQMADYAEPKMGFWSSLGQSFMEGEPNQSIPDQFENGLGMLKRACNALEK